MTLSIPCYHAECRVYCYAEFRYSTCRYAEYRIIMSLLCKHFHPSLMLPSMVGAYPN
jgi:hypothetical protein